MAGDGPALESRPGLSRHDAGKEGADYRGTRWRRQGTDAREWRRVMGGLVQYLVFALIAAGAGVSFVMQQAVNADLRLGIGSAPWAGFVSYLGGTVAMALFALVLRDPSPQAAVLARSHWWAWSGGGVFGAIYIAVSILLLPRLGAGGA